MAFLQCRRKNMKLSTNFKKPSPTYHTNKLVSDSARNPDIHSSGTAKMPSLFVSLFKELNAGMTVEASIVLPLFLFFFMNLASSIEMIRLHGNLQLALWKTGSELAVYGYALNAGVMPDEEQTKGAQTGMELTEAAQPGGEGHEWEDSGGAQPQGDREDSWWKRLSGAIFSAVFVKGQLVQLLGEDYLDASPLRSGTDSLMLWESEVFGTGDTLDLVVTYSVAPWTETIGFLSFRMANRYYGHIWNGYAVSGQAQTGVTVYIAENGQVYHSDRSCTHLRLSIQKIRAENLDSVRNNYGKRYGACERCVRGRKVEIIYITGEGDKYHYNRDCPGLKRTVSPMLKSDAEKRYRPCSRCGTEKKNSMGEN